MSFEKGSTPDRVKFNLCKVTVARFGGVATSQGCLRVQNPTFGTFFL